MNRTALASLAFLASLGLAGAPALAHAHDEGLPGHAPDPTPAEVTVEVGRHIHAGDDVHVPLDPTRALLQAEVLWNDRVDDSRGAIVVDGFLFGRRFVGEREREVVRIGRAGSELRVVIERGHVDVDRVVLRYEPSARAWPPVIEPTSVAVTGPLSRTAHFHRDFESGMRLRLPAGLTGRRIAEVRVQARALDFRARLRLEGAGDPLRAWVARADTYVFTLRDGPADVTDLTLVADFRRVRVEDVTIVLAPDDDDAGGHGPGHGYGRGYGRRPRR